MADNLNDGPDEQSEPRTDWDAEPKRAHSVERTGATASAGGTGGERAREQSLFREERDEREDAARAQADAERERLLAERAARREARLAALAPVEPDPQVQASPARQVGRPAPAAGATLGSGASAADTVPVRTETVRVTERSTDKFAGALALFLLRLVVAAIVGIRGLYHLLNLPATTELVQGTVLPYASILAIALGAAEVAIAVALVFGLLTRLAGIGLMLVAGGALGFVLWGPWSPFIAGQAGFTGELELLLVAVGALFLLVGAGGWSVDRGFRTRRTETRGA